MEILAQYPTVQVVYEPRQSGLVAGYALGARHATGALLFFCNEDLYLGANCLRDLVDRIDLGQGVAASDPWQWTYDGAEWIHGGVRFKSARWDFNSPFPFRRQDPVTPLPSGAVIPFGCAGAMLIDAAVYHEIGGWDPSFFMDDEDIDLFIRAWQRGWTCVTVPSARVFHAVGASSVKSAGQGRPPVNQLRYVSGRCNVSVVALKYFSLRAVWLGVLMWVLTLTKDVVLMRCGKVRLDFLALWEIGRRLPQVVAYRRANRRLNRRMPGERFFLQRRFAR